MLRFDFFKCVHIRSPEILRQNLLVLCCIYPDTYSLTSKVEAFRLPGGFPTGDALRLVRPVETSRQDEPRAHPLQRQSVHLWLDL